MDMDVALTSDEMLHAAQVGIQRQIQNLIEERRPAHGADDQNDWQKQVEGAMGEKAVSVVTGIPWDGNLGDLEADDVGPYQVRTRSQHRYDLTIYPKDRNDKIFILVTGINGKYKVQGWIRGGEAKQRQYWKAYTSGRPAYFVPKEALHDIKDLIF
jgi:hypothetical protein